METRFRPSHLKQNILKSNLYQSPAIAGWRRHANFACLRSYNLASSLNSKGRLTQVSNTNSTTNFQSFDSMGRVTQGNQITGNTYSFANYTYNYAGLLTSETLPSGKVIGNSIDSAGRVAGVYKTGSYYVGAVETDATNRILYAPQGTIAQMRLGTGLWDQTRFNKRLQPTQMGVGQTTPGGIDIDLTTTYANRLLLGNCYSNVDPNCSAAGTANNNGNVLRQLIQAPSLSLTQVFTYDPLNRLDSASESGGGTPWAQDYAYGRFGNRAVVGVGDYIPAPALTPISIAAYNGNTNQRNSAGYAYDASGNLITEATTRTMTYDAENRMVTFNGGSGTTTYTYDGDGRRVKKVDNGSVTSVYVYDALGRMAAEYSSAAFSGPGGTSYISGDHLGSTRLVINPDYSVRGRHDYLPFGEEIGTDKGGRAAIPGYGAIEFRQKFTSKERDSESSLDFFLARYFSGPQGRFITEEPLNIPALQWVNSKQFVAIITNPQNWNGYAYTRNNPLRNIDPDGFLTIIVPGTWNDNEDWKKSKFRAQVEKTFGEKAVVLTNNNMGNTKEARAAAARQLEGIVANHKFASGEKLNIVAHSHGGNVVAEATQEGLSHKIDTLVTLGTPIRTDYQFNESTIGLHLNVFSKHDAVQPIGGPMTIQDGPMGQVFMRFDAGREIRLPGVRNLDATSQAGGHSELWNKPGTWDKVVVPELKK